MKSEQRQKESKTEKVAELLRGLVACWNKQFAAGERLLETLMIDAINLIGSCCRLEEDFFN